MGKTNTPEFGAGSQTYNEVFGETLNPYDTTKTCGGSSGGAAVALACGMVPIADGSDMGGSSAQPGFLLQRRWFQAVSRQGALLALHRRRGPRSPRRARWRVRYGTSP